MTKQTGAIVLLMGGVALTYLALTGYAGGVWDALHGPDGGKKVSDTSGGGKAVPLKADGAAGGVSRAIGRGRGGEVANIPTPSAGYWSPLPTGGIYTTAAGRW